MSILALRYGYTLNPTRTLLTLCGASKKKNFIYENDTNVCSSSKHINQCTKQKPTLNFDIGLEWGWSKHKKSLISFAALKSHVNFFLKNQQIRFSHKIKKIPINPTRMTHTKKIKQL